MSPTASRRRTWNFLNPFDIRKGEGKKTVLMFLYFFLTITVLYVLKPVRSSLFLEELGSQNLRYVYLGEGVFLLFVTWAYVQLAKLLPRKKFFMGVLLVFISNLLIFWWLLHIRAPYLSAFFYVWVACFSITSVTQFWTLANDIFDPLEAKRLFGLIISGGSAGGVLGGLLTTLAVRWVRTEDLLLLSSLLLSGCIAAIALLWKHVPAASLGPGHGASPLKSRQSTLKLFLTSPYLWMLGGIVLLAKVGSTVVDNQFNAVVEIHLLGKEAKTAFFGAFSAALNIISLLMQLFATSFSMRILGIGISLSLLPVGLGVFSLATFVVPTLLTATFLKIFDGSFNYSIQQTSKEVLYLPLSSGVRYRAKPVIDMLVYRASKSLGGLLIILLAPLFAIPNERIGVLVLVLLPFWLILVWKMREAYLLLLRQHLWKGKPQGTVPKPRRATDILSFLHSEKSFGQLRSFFTQESAVARKMAATACLVYRRSGKDLEATRRFINEMTRWGDFEAPLRRKGEKRDREEKQFLDELLLGEAEKEVARSKESRPHAHENSQPVLTRLAALLEEPNQEMVLKREAAEFFERRATQETADRLLEILSKSHEHPLRFLLIRTLLRIRDRNPEIQWNRSLIKEEILRECELWCNIQSLRAFYLKISEKREEFLEVALNAIADESLERLFRCLGLLYPGEGIRIIYERLVEHPTSDPVRSHAIELLHNLLGPEFYEVIEKLFGESGTGDLSEEEAVSILEKMMSSPDRWLLLIAQFLITESKLARRWPKLESLVSTRSFETLDI